LNNVRNNNEQVSDDVHDDDELVGQHVVCRPKKSHHLEECPNKQNAAYSQCQLLNVIGDRCSPRHI